MCVIKAFKHLKYNDTTSKISVITWHLGVQLIDLQLDMWSIGFSQVGLSL